MIRGCRWSKKSSNLNGSEQREIPVSAVSTNGVVPRGDRKWFDISSFFLSFFIGR